MSAPAKTPAPRDGHSDNEVCPDHPVNVPGEYRYSVGGPFGRAMYQQQRTSTGENYWRRRCELPYVHARVVRRDGSARRIGTDYLVSATVDGPRLVLSDDELTDGSWAARLGMELSSHREIITAAGTAVRSIAYRDAPEREATARPDAHTATGHLDIPVAECLPTGYLAMPPGVDPAVARETMREVVGIVAGLPKMALVMGASAGAPYVGPLRRQSHWVDLHGDSRKGKSTAHAAAAALWGDPRIGTGIVLGWNASAIGTPRHLGQLGILPPFLDERGLAPFSRDQWGEIVYATCQGASRLTAERLGTGTRRSAPWFGVLFSTGNNRLTEQCSAGRFAGVPARVIELATPLTDSAEQSERLTDVLLPRCYGWLGPAVLETYTVPMVRELIDAAAATIGTPPGGVPGTLAKHLHLAVAGAAMIDALVGTGTALADAATLAAREYLDVHGHEPRTDADRMIDALVESLAARRSAWPSAAEYTELGRPRPEWANGTREPDRPELAQHGYDQEVRGVCSDDGQWLYVMPSTWRALADELGTDSSAACAELHRRGVLHVAKGARRRGEWHSQPRIDGQPVRVYQLALSAIERDDQGDDEPPAPTLPAGPVPMSPQPASTGSDQHGPDVPTGPRPDAGPCLVCRVAGGWCGLGQVASQAAPCVVCAEPTSLRSACGAPRTAQCAPAPTSLPEPAAAPAATVPAPRGAAPAAKARSTARTSATTAAMARLAAGEPLRLLDDLEGPFAPMRRAEGRLRRPYWRPELPGITYAARVVTGWRWSRPYTGPVAVLDRSGAWVAAASSAEVAHGPLEHTGELEFAGLPGYYQVQVHPWHETGMPHPLGNPAQDTVWVPAPTLKLLADLAEQGRWADATVLDSYTGDPVRLSKWTGHVNELRAHAIGTYGRDSDQYGQVKTAFGQALSLMLGTLAESGVGRTWRCSIQRPDWTHTVQAQASATLWRWADDCRQVARELPPVALQNVDELVIPAAALEIVTTTPRPGARKPLTIDTEGIRLGSFKVKHETEWTETGRG